MQKLKKKKPIKLCDFKGCKEPINLKRDGGYSSDLMPDKIFCSMEQYMEALRDKSKIKEKEKG